MSSELVVTGIGVVTPWGDGPEAADAPRTGLREDWFDVKERLGPRGYKYLPFAAQTMLAAAAAALADAGGIEDVPEEERAAAVGTNSGGEALHAEMDRTIIATSADDLSPALAPFFSINLFGSRLATEHGLKGFNLTLTSPRIAGLEALELGARAVRHGRASWLLAGATEAPLDAGDPGAGASESGAVALVCEPRDRALARNARIYGSCVARSFFLPPRLAGALALDAFEAGAGAATVRAVVDTSPVGSAVAAALGADALRVHAGSGCLEPLLQAAGALAAGRDELIVTAAAEGNVAVVRIVPERAPLQAALAGERSLDVELA